MKSRKKLGSPELIVTMGRMSLNRKDQKNSYHLLNRPVNHVTFHRYSVTASVQKLPILISKSNMLLVIYQFMENTIGYSLSVFIAFFAIMNPFVNIPIFVKLTEGQNEKKKAEIARSASLLAFFIVAFFILIGKYIFELFGLTIPAFKIFGGTLIFYIGFEMLQTKKAVIQLQKSEAFDEVITIAPLAIPILAGPETIVTGMNFVVNANFFHILISISILGLLLFLTYLGFIHSSKIIRTLGKNNFIIAGKIMGIVLGVLGANMLIEGIKLAFNV